MKQQKIDPRGSNLNEQVCEISSKLQDFFSIELEKAILESGLVQRERVLSGSDFIKICFEQVLENGFNSVLRNFCQGAAARGVVDLREESFNGRFHERSVDCAKRLLCSLMEKQFYPKQQLNCLNQFTSVFIQDSTVEAFDKLLVESFPGSGGSGSVASVKIDACIDLKQSESIGLKVKTGKQNDNLEKPVPVSKSLVLRDLGYFDLTYLAKLHSEGAFFVSRVKCNTYLYTKDAETADFVALDLTKLSKKMVENQQLDMEIWVGKKTKFPARLVLKKLSASVSADKRRKLKAKAKTKIQDIPEQQLAFCDFSLVITNISKDNFDATQVYDLYRIRWQIELFFKAWKSYLGLQDLDKKMKPHRTITLLYIWLTISIIYHKLVSIQYIYLWNNNNFELSIIKAFDICNDHKQLFINAINDKIANFKINFTKYVQNIFADFVLFAQKSVKGKDRKNSTLFSFS